MTPPELPGVTLALDAAAGMGTVAVLRDDVLLSEATVEMRSDREERFFPAVLDTLERAGVGSAELARIVCGAGPGSFTALRVTGAIAKGLAVGGDTPLHQVASLGLIVAASEATRAPGLWLATLDAMRDDRYLALVRTGEGGVVRSVESMGLAPATELVARAERLGAKLIGPDEALRAVPHARGVLRCLALLSAVGAVDVASWEPVYGRLAEAQVKWEALHGVPLVVDRLPS